MDPSDERSKLVYARDFLREAREMGLLDDPTFLRLRDALEVRWVALRGAEGRTGAARTAAPVGAPGRPPSARSSQRALPPPPMGGATPTADVARPAARVPAPVRSPVADGAGRGTVPRAAFSPAWAERARRLRELVASDLGVHGLAYLGVLLLFAGTFGFVFFAFRDLVRGLRPVAEAAIPSAFFLSAWFLRRRRAPLVAKGVELVGGALLPVVALASFVDGAPPSDLSGPGLVVAAILATLAIAVAYRVWSIGHPVSPLRYLTAPVAWLAVALAGFFLKHDEPLRGLAIERPMAWQMALGAASVAATLAAIRRAPRPAARPTVLAAVPGIALTYAVTLTLAASEGWPAGPVVLSGAAVLVALELFGERLKDRGALATLEPLVLGVTLSPLIPSIGAALAGVVAVAVFLGLLEWRARNRPTPVVLALALAGAATGLGLATTRPWPAVVAWGLAAVWVHARRLVPGSIGGRSAATAIDVGASIVPIGVGVGLFRALPAGEAWLAMAAILAAASLVVHVGRPDDALLAWWIPAAAAAVAIGVGITRVGNPDVSRWQLAVAAALSAGALGFGRRWPAVRVWSAAVAGALALSLGLDAAGVAHDIQPLAWSGAGLAAVAAAALWRGRPAGHLSASGHLVTLGALFAAAAPRGHVAILALWTLAWLCETSAQELASGGAPLAGLLTRLGRSVGNRAERTARFLALRLAPLALVSSVPFLVVRGGALNAAFARHRSWSGVALAATAIAYALLARALAGRRPLAVILATAAVSVSAVGISVAAPAPWASIDAVAAAVGAVALLGGELRRPFMNVFAWTMSGLLAVLLANRAGVPVGSLNLVGLAWGTVLLVGGLAYDDMRSGRRRPGEGVRVPWLAQPVALGALAVPVSLGPVFTYGQTAFGWWMLAAAGLYLLVALQLRAGAVTGVTYALSTAGLAALSPWSPLAHPWIFAPWCAVLVGLSWLVARTLPRADAWSRWDLAPLVVAHGIAGVALARSIDAGTVPATWLAFGGLSIAVAAMRRHWAWVAGGVALVLVGAGAAGPAWLALALAAVSTAATATAARTARPARTILQGAGIVAAGWAWLEVVVAANRHPNQSVAATSVAFGGLALIVGGLAGFRRLRLEWVAWWGGLAVGGVLAAGVVAVGPDGLRYLDGSWPAAGTAMLAAGAVIATRVIRPAWLKAIAVAAVGWSWIELVAGMGWPASAWMPVTALASGAIAMSAAGAHRIGKLGRTWTLALGGLAAVASMFAVAALGLIDRRPGGMAVAGGLAMLAAACAMAARPLDWPELREATAALALAVGSALAYAFPPAVGQRGLEPAAAGFAATIATLVLWRRRSGSPWLRPLAVFGVAASVTAVPFAASAWPHRSQLVVSLLVAGTEAAAAGLTLQRIRLLYLSPILLCTAWLIYASEALRGNPQPFTVPIGLALLALVELARWDRRRAGKQPVTEELVILELVGIGLLVGAALVQTVSTHLLYGLLAIALAGSVMAWGGMTRVRRRCGIGAGLALLAVALMLAAPIAHNLPRFHGAALWVSVAGVGAALIAVATLLEQGRTKVRAAVRRIGELTEGWE